MSASRPAVLIVEDELIVRMFAVEALDSAGFRTVEAGDAAEAQALLNADLKALIIDLGLPDRSGDELAAEVRASHADLPIVIASGRSERELKEKFAKDSRIAVLTKPYTAALLLDSLESLGVKSHA